MGTGVLIKGSQCDSRSFASYSRMAAQREKNRGSAWLLQQTTSRQSTYPWKTLRKREKRKKRLGGEGGEGKGKGRRSIEVSASFKDGKTGWGRRNKKY